MITSYSQNIPEAFCNVLWSIKTCSVEEESRNGPVRSMTEPFFLTIENPRQRVLTDPVRDANPFFHVMEFVWMMAGSNDIRWISKFNKNMMSYSNDGITQPAAYGYRWRRHFSFDQINVGITMLRKDPTTRRVVLGMWDPHQDLGFLTTKDSADIPCNTQIILRIVKGKLNFLVTNRSNDAIWGMLGANAVHMTLLHELIADALHVEVGEYQVLSNNLHIYKSVPNYDYFMTVPPEPIDVYRRADYHVPVLQHDETYDGFTADAHLIVMGMAPKKTFWMKNVAWPIYQAWTSRKDTDQILAPDWRIACEEWISRRLQSR